MEDLEEAKTLEKIILKVFDKTVHNSTNESSETEALELLSQLPNPAEVRDDNKVTLLHYACYNGWYEVARVLLEKYNCDPNCRTASGSIPLLPACFSGNLDLVKYLILVKDCNPNDENNRGEVPLHYAAFGGHLDITKFLVEHCKVDSGVKDNSGFIPLHCACQGGPGRVKVKHSKKEQQCIENEDGHSSFLKIYYKKEYLFVAKYLIEVKECIPSCKNNDGVTPLQLSCMNGYLDMAKYLIEEQQCDPTCCDNNGWTPLHIACQHGCLDIVKYLTEEQQCDPACKEKDGKTPLHLACMNGHIHVAKYLIENWGCNPICRDNYGQTPLYFACGEGHLNVAEYLTKEQHVNPVIKTNNNRLPLHVACFDGHVDVTEFLLIKCQNDPMYKDFSYSSSFTYALKKNHLDIVNLIIRSIYKEEVQCGRTYLHSASIRGDLEIIRFIIEDQQCSPQLKDNEGLTPLHLSSKHGHLDIVRYLVIFQNCNATCKANDGSVPSSLAIANNHINVATFLLQNEYGVHENNLLIISACRAGHTISVQYLAKNFNPHVRDSNGLAPLHIACEKGYLKIVKCLIQEANCDPMCMTSDAWTPLHSASQYGKLDVIKYLTIDQECDPNSRTLTGITPLHLACKHQHFDIVVYLVTECIGDCLSSLPCYDDSLMEEALKSGKDDIVFFLMSHGVQFTSKYYTQIDSYSRLVQPALKVFILGNAMSGKSTLVKALMSNLIEERWFSKILNPKVTGIEPHTAGIIPYHAHSQTYGRIILYDFAGQHEHYSSSHAAILEKLRCAQSDLVFIVVDISRPKEQLVKELKYWDSFVSNQYEQEKPPIIVIGSHFDVAKQQGKQSLLQALSELPHLNVSITLDCTRKSSVGLTEICKQISTFSKSHHEKFNISAQVHFLNRLLQDEFKNEITCQLQGVFDLIGHEDNAVLRKNNLLPLTMDALSNQVSKLSEHGQLVYIEDSEDIKLSWLILGRRFCCQS